MKVDSVQRKTELAETGQSALELTGDPLSQQPEVSLRDWVAVFCSKRIEPGEGVEVNFIYKREKSFYPSS